MSHDNFGLAYDKRKPLSEVIYAGLEHPSPRMRRMPTECADAVTHIAARLARPGPPIVSAADVHDLLDALKKCEEERWAAERHEAHTPEWARVKYLHGSIMWTRHGWRVALDHHADGNWQADLATCLRIIYEDHLRSRGLLPDEARYEHPVTDDLHHAPDGCEQRLKNHADFDLRRGRPRDFVCSCGHVFRREPGSRRWVQVSATADSKVVLSPGASVTEGQGEVG